MTNPKKSYPRTKIPTKDRNGKPNGYLLTLYNIHEKIIPKVEQVYLTVCLPGMVKGPHLHMKRYGYFVCIKGDAVVITKIKGRYYGQMTGENHNYNMVHVPKGVPACVKNIGKCDAFILNFTSPAWTKEDPDAYHTEFAESVLTTDFNRRGL